MIRHMILTGVVIAMLVHQVLLWWWTTTPRWKGRVKEAPPAPPSYVNELMLEIIRSQGEIAAEMTRRGIEAVVAGMERVTYGPTPAANDQSLDESPPPADINAPPWEDWESRDEVAEYTDAPIPEWADINGPRIASVANLPDFTGENL